MPERQSPYLPDSVLQRPEFIQACHARDLGRILKIAQKWTGFTYSHMSRQCEMSVNSVSDYINGRRQAQSLDVFTRVANGLHIPGAMLGLHRQEWENEPAHAAAEPVGQATERQFRDSSRAPSKAATPGEDNVHLLPLVDGPAHNTNADAAAMRAFRAADLQVGGGHLYASVLRYLQRDIAPKLFGTEEGPGNADIFSAAAALTEMAGWMAHDAGQDQQATQHFSRSLALTQISGDHQLGAHVLSSMSHLANHRNQPQEAITLAQRGQTVLESAPPNPGLKARLLTMEARGLAGLGESSATIKLLIQAESSLAKTPADTPSPWVSQFDAGSFASEAARCTRQLGDWNETKRQAEQIIRLRPSGRTRSRAFGQLTLTTVLLAQSRYDEACSLAQEVLDSTQALGSFLVIQQLLNLSDSLQPHRANKTVEEFLTRLDDTLRDRLWLYRRPTDDRHGYAPNHQEDT